MPREKYNIGDDDLYLWRCHPEKVCINCKDFEYYRRGGLRMRNEGVARFYMRCAKYCWIITQADSKGKHVTKLLMARNCRFFKAREE